MSNDANERVFGLTFVFGFDQIRYGFARYGTYVGWSFLRGGLYTH